MKKYYFEDSEIEQLKKISRGYEFYMTSGAWAEDIDSVIEFKNPNDCTVWHNQGGWFTYPETYSKLKSILHYCSDQGGVNNVE